MHNLKNTKGTYKGLIGECLFKSTKRYLVVTKFFNKNKYFRIFQENFSQQEKEFLEKNWFSIDAIEFNYNVFPRKAVLYEIKTRNIYSDPHPHWKLKMTQTTHELYTLALQIGFDVKFVIVWLYDNWDYEIEVKDFHNSNYVIDKPKLYDRK